MTSLAEATQGTASSLAAKTFSPQSYGILVASVDALEKLSKIGSKQGKVVKRLVKMIRYARMAADVFYAERDTLTNFYAARDEDGSVKVVTIDSDKGLQKIIFENEPEYNLKINELMRKEAELETVIPPPFTFEEVLTCFKSPAEPSVIAALGPFIKMDDDKEPDNDA